MTQEEEVKFIKDSTEEYKLIPKFLIICLISGIVGLGLVYILSLIFD